MDRCVLRASVLCSAVQRPECIKAGQGVERRRDDHDTPPKAAAAIVTVHDGCSATNGGRTFLLPRSTTYRRVIHHLPLPPPIPFPILHLGSSTHSPTPPCVLPCCPSSSLSPVSLSFFVLYSLVQVVGFLLPRVISMASSSSYGSTAMPSSSTTAAPYGTGTTTYSTTTNPNYASSTPYDPSSYSSTTTSTTTSSTTGATYAPPSVPIRTVNAVNAGDIRTTNQGPDLHSTSSFTTNTGVAATPIDLSNEPLAKPSSGLVHMFKKMTMGSSMSHDLESDAVMTHADQALSANMNGARSLHTEIQRYQAAQAALQAATVSVANAFHSVLADESNPYAPLSSELVRQSQMHSMVPSNGAALSDLTNSAVEDTDSAYAEIRQRMSSRKTKASDVEYYMAKVQKLTADHETAMGKGDVKASDKERLERNIGKMREIELEYNQENERLIADMNALWRRRIIRLGPALTTFLLSNQLVHTEQAQMFTQLTQQARAINPDLAHNMYLSSNASVLVPEGSAFVDNRGLINTAHQTGIKADVVSAQRHLQQEQADRHNSVSQAGGKLETVAQETIIRSEEQMRITKERFVTERVRLRKVVTTEMVTISVPVRKERVEVQRFPVNGPGIPVTASQSLEEEQRRAQRRQGRANTNTGTSAHAANDARVVEDEEEESFEMILSEERPRVINDVVPIERVRLRKLRQVTAQSLEMDLMREHIDFNAPRTMPGQPQTVTMTGALQTVSGQNTQGFTDATNGQARVVVTQANAVGGVGKVGSTTTTTTGTSSATGREYMKAEVDDVEGMKRLGFGDQAGAYGAVNTVGMVSSTGVSGSSMPQYTKEGVVGTNHPYYNNGGVDSSSSTTTTTTAGAGTGNTLTDMTAASTISPDSTATQPPVNRPVV